MFKNTELYVSDRTGPSSGSTLIVVLLPDDGIVRPETCCSLAFLNVLW
jgi:hypothetical protein